MGSTQPQVTQERWLSKLLPLAFLPLSRPLRSLHPLRAAQGKDSGDLASSSLQLRWTLPVQPDPHWELNLLLPLRPVSVEKRPSSLRRLEPLRLRGGGGVQTRGRNAQLLSRSGPRWGREWKVTGACSPNLAGSMRMETRTTRLQPDLMTL